MNQTTLIKKFHQCKTQIAKFKKRKGKELDVYLRKFIKENCPTVEKKVYELTGRTHPKRRGFKRFVVYINKITVWDKWVSITSWGWWLDANNIPRKWDHISVYGFSNSESVMLSKNQKHEKHPDAKKK